MQPFGSSCKKAQTWHVFYTLANIAPKFRLQLKLINLAIVATVPIIEKYGLTGISVSVHGMPRQFKGVLLAFLADNLAANDLGGFKKSFSFSFCCCRTSSFNALHHEVSHLQTWRSSECLGGKFFG